MNSDYPQNDKCWGWSTRWSLSRPSTCSFSLPKTMKLENLDGLARAGSHGQTSAPGSAIAQVFASYVDPTLTWKFIAWVRGVTALPLVLKVCLLWTHVHQCRQAKVHNLVLAGDCLFAHESRTIELVSCTLIQTAVLLALPWVVILRLAWWRAAIYSCQELSGLRAFCVSWELNQHLMWAVFSEPWWVNQYATYSMHTLLFISDKAQSAIGWKSQIRTQGVRQPGIGGLQLYW